MADFILAILFIGGGMALLAAEHPELALPVLGIFMMYIGARMISKGE